MSHVNEAVKRILEHVRDPSVIVLLGGYSRGEGSVAREHDGIIPLGDYDFMVITKSPTIFRKEIPLDDLARRFGIGHLDVSIYWQALLPHVPKRIFWYELKFGSRAVFGNPRVLDTIPLDGPKDIILSEGISLMFNRLDGLLRNFHPRFFMRPPSHLKRRILIFETIKAILACGDSLLVLSHKYHYSYRQRVEILRETILLDHKDFLAANPRFMQEYEEATNFKLAPEFEKITEPVNLWLTACNYLLYGAIYYLKKWTGFEALDQNRFPEVLLSLSKFGLRDFLSYNFLSGRKTKPIRTLFQVRRSFSDMVRASLFLLASSVKEGRIDPNPVDRAMELISEISNLDKETTRDLDTFQRWVLVRDTIDRAWASTSR
jgi:hypothetical protein